MDDEGAAVCYALGVNYIEQAGAIAGATFQEEVRHILALKRRSPGLAVNVGCGLGMIDAALVHAGVPCVGIDPSAGAKEGYAATFAAWLGSTEYRFVNEKADRGIDRVVDLYGAPDTVIMCESIEHIPKSEFDAFWSTVVPLLRASKGRFIVTNGLSDLHFPIVVDGTGWCHIRAIDDRLYDELAAAARETVVRHKGHLVLQF
jgi:hypothetical protein